ncbi:hypothetical protein SSPO_084290 [Streptomyces antimycoticus]|uniref:Uncharacterized protein n=1 Tax=Streptomyces antimycoticus TaxID=68175 RepID=A0A499V860_9ACTN|nr:hypothetical protein SSPO_084290 [Streptomyces antimycoticus]
MPLARPCRATIAFTVLPPGSSFTVVAVAMSQIIAQPNPPPSPRTSGVRRWGGTRLASPTAMAMASGWADRRSEQNRPPECRTALVTSSETTSTTASAAP